MELWMRAVLGLSSNDDSLGRSLSEVREVWGLPAGRQEPVVENLKAVVILQT